ncbi:hypothetical protein PRIPAC_76782 [Pristionchus pacificus]|uniref:Prohibitin n=1 Tax=Pristionchus pacificus TaxID=54126 RepID=A0A454XQK5_PRIPA|nr:hypothetical protein PRIPAC_76782 [Pristionchus pacificus]|eukprot:PDM79376.1 hypothetical protein PRIPAC_31955 [Pristionchus pacificus]
MAEQGNEAKEQELDCSLEPEHLTKIYRTLGQNWEERRALDFNLILDDFSLTELTFSPQYSVAVKAKQVAAQEAPRASFVVERAK